MHLLCSNAVGDVANSKCPLLVILKVQLRLCVTCRSATALARYPQKCNYTCSLPTEVRKSFLQVKNLVTAQTQLRLYSEQQRAFGISNICYSINLKEIDVRFTLDKLFCFESFVDLEVELTFYITCDLCTDGFKYHHHDL